MFSEGVLVRTTSVLKGIQVIIDNKEKTGEIVKCRCSSVTTIIILKTIKQ
jgi:hypothetical protein